MSNLILVIVCIALIIAGPLITIWSLNTLFTLGIAYSFWTWLATIWISLATFGGIQGSLHRIEKK